jgi:hypothetical protein
MLGSEPQLIGTAFISIMAPAPPPGGLLQRGHFGPCRHQALGLSLASLPLVLPQEAKLVLLTCQGSRAGQVG